MRKMFFIVILLLTSCGTRVTWESSIARGSLHYESSSDHTRLNNALKNAIEKINLSDLPDKGKAAVVQLVNNDINAHVVDAVYAKLKKENISLLKIKERDADKKNFDYLLFVYSPVYGVKQEGMVYPDLSPVSWSGDRIAEVSIYSRLLDVKKNKIVWEKTYDGSDNSIYAIYTYPVFEADQAKIDMLVRQSQQGR